MNLEKYDKKTLLLFCMILALLILLILNYKKSQKICALESKLQGTVEKMEDSSHESPILLSTSIDKKDQDTIRLFYADWCGHSQIILPIWETFTIEYGNKLKIEKIDCEAERNKCQSVSGFPTIRLYKGGNDKVIEFSGERTVDGLKKFVDNNITPIFQ